MIEILPVFDGALKFRPSIINKMPDAKETILFKIG